METICTGRLVVAQSLGRGVQQVIMPQRGGTTISSSDTEGSTRATFCLLPSRLSPSQHLHNVKGRIPARNRPLRGACIKAAARNQVLALTPPS